MALKLVDRAALTKRALAYVDIECAAMLKVRGHPNILFLHSYDKCALYPRFLGGKR